MEGYDVITSDEHKLGHVVLAEGDFLIVEHGHLRRKQFAVPNVFAHVDDSEQVVRLSVSKELVEDTPPVEDGKYDRRAIAEHYGLAEGYVDPETKGEGDLLLDDPAWSEEIEERRTGIEPAGQRRTRIRKAHEPGPRGRQIIPPDSHE